MGLDLVGFGFGLFTRCAVWGVDYTTILYHLESRLAPPSPLPARFPFDSFHLLPPFLSPYPVLVPVRYCCRACTHVRQCRVSSPRPIPDSRVLFPRRRALALAFAVICYHLAFR